MDRLEARVRFLSDHLKEGREAGMRAYDLAALYVAEQFRAFELQPAGDDYLVRPEGKGEIIDISTPLVFGGSDYFARHPTAWSRSSTLICLS